MTTRQFFTAFAAVSLFFANTAGVLAGADDGPKGTRETVYAGSRDTYNITFRGGELAQVVAKTDHAGDDIDLFIYDENDQLVARDTMTDGIPVCRWAPKWTGKFRIVVKNCEDVNIRYSLVTN